VGVGLPDELFVVVMFPPAVMLVCEGVKFAVGAVQPVLTVIEVFVVFVKGLHELEAVSDTEYVPVFANVIVGLLAVLFGEKVTPLEGETDQE
jgi:hypothetical protein